ncbi:MAG: LptA/OstA family protein [Pseudomonadota bacterium]
MLQRIFAFVFVVAFAPTLILAQGANISLGGGAHDTQQPVEVSADSLDINQEDGSALFSGNVVVIQGDVRLAAEDVRVLYSTGDEGGAGQIDTIRATGGVTLVTQAEAAESSDAEYAVASGDIVMTGNVLLTQGINTLGGDRLVIDLETGTGRMEGNVRTIFQSSEN